MEEGMKPPRHRPRTWSQIDRDEALRFAQKKERFDDVEAPSRKLFAVTIEAIGAPLDAVPKLAIAPELLSRLTLDDAALSVIARIDGAATVEDLLARLDLRPEAVFSALNELVDRGIVRITPV
jgi:hypothetical protein